MAKVDRGKHLRKVPIEDYRAKVRKQIISGMHVNKETSCWIWRRSHSRNGYGQTRYLGKQTVAHRASYQAFIGVIDEGKEICHICDVRNCVNPLHLFMATHAENMLDLQRKKRGRNGFMTGNYIPTRDELGRFKKQKGIENGIAK